MIEGLVTALGVKLDLTGEEIADVLWLVAHMQAPDQVVEEINQPTREKQPSSDGRDVVADRTELPNEENKCPKKADSSTEAEGELYPEEDRQGLEGLSFQVPDARSLREPLELARALKPLLRRVPSDTLEQVLDEEATVQRIADERIWAPVLQPALEPWLDLVLVVDESSSMLIWQRTVLEFQRILERYGVFRNVSTWSLTPEGDANLKLCPGLGKIARNQRSHSPSELLDPNGRRLVVVASDCVSPMWQQRTVLPLLKLWAENGPLVIAQMLPQWLWNRTALGLAAGAEFSGLEPGIPNKRLTTRPLSRRSKVNLQAGIKIPVVTLQSEEFSTWADMLTGKGNTWAKGFVYSSDIHVKAAISPIREVPASLTAEERVQRFRITASPMARKLASLLASAPVINLPIVRIIQDSLLKDSRQVHVAEVFLGGLLEQVTEINSGTKSYNVHFDFFRGVRELLLESVPKAEIIDAINEVSAFVAENIGLTLEEFVAVLRNPEKIRNSALTDQTRPFAKVTTQVLRRLGGSYAQFASQLEKSLSPSKDNHPEKVLQIRTRPELQTILNQSKHEFNNAFVFDIGRLYRALNPNRTMALELEQDRQHYIDFSELRGHDVTLDLLRTIWHADFNPTCQLLTGHIGCGKSVELSRLKALLEANGYHVVYFKSTDDLDMGDVDISDILLAIAKQVSKSLEEAKLRLTPSRFQQLIKSTADLLNSEVPGLKIKTPEVGGLKVSGDLGLSAEGGSYSLSLGVGEITTKAKDSKNVRALLRQHLEPRIKTILDIINGELIDTANRQLLDQGKAGLVVIVDNLDRIDNKPRVQDRRQPEYLFVDRGDQLKQLRCHVVYTIPLVLSFSNEKENLTNRFGASPQVLPMVRTQNRDGSACEAGLEALRQMILARAFPELPADQRLGQLGQIFDSSETLDRLCLASGGHVRTLLVLVNDCLKKADPPLTQTLLDQVISLRLSDLTRAIEAEEWGLLREVHRTKAVQGEGEYQALLRSLFVFEYKDTEQTWFDVNPILLRAREFEER